MVVASAAVCFLLILSLVLSHSTTKLIHAVVQLDRGVIVLLNGFARRSWRFDVLISQVSHSAILQGVMVALFWGAWFAPSDASAGRRRRETMLASLIGLYATVALAIAIRAALPFRPRPVVELANAFQVPYLGFDGTLHASSTSFPAGHAAVFCGLAVGLWSVSARLGLLSLLYALLIICLPRMYLGLHYPTDILAGAVLAIVTVPLVNEILQMGSLVRRVLAWSEKHSALFYGLLFLCSLDIAMEFSAVRPLVSFLGGAKKLVMLAIGVAV